MTNARIAPSPQVHFTDLGDGTAVLFHARRMEYLTLNETATLVWRTLTAVGAPTGIAPLVAALVAAYDVDEPEAEEAVVELLDELRASDFIATTV